MSAPLSRCLRGFSRYCLQHACSEPEAWKISYDKTKTGLIDTLLRSMPDRLGWLMVAQDDRRESWVRVPESGSPATRFCCWGEVARHVITPGGAKPASADRWFAEPGVRREKILFRAAAGRSGARSRGATKTNAFFPGASRCCAQAFGRVGNVPSAPPAPVLTRPSSRLSGDSSPVPCFP